MIVHYLVIWLTDGDMRTRKETPMDLELETIDEETALWRYQSVKGKLSQQFNVTVNRIFITNICRL